MSHHRDHQSSNKRTCWISTSKFSSQQQSRGGHQHGFCSGCHSMWL
jgi:hypothetical protein